MPQEVEFPQDYYTFRNAVVRGELKVTKEESALMNRIDEMITKDRGSKAALKLFVTMKTNKHNAE